MATDGDRSDNTWDQIAGCIEAYQQACDSSDLVVAIADFLPDADPEVRRIVLLELSKLFIKHGFDSGRTPLVEHCLAGMQTLMPAESVPIDLVLEEIHIRQHHELAVDFDVYRDRFPHLADSLDQFRADDPTDKRSIDNFEHPASQLRPGESVDDFLLLRLLGVGGFASVFLARQISMQRLVALKVSSVHGDESMTLAKFDHPHIVRVYDQRELADPPCELLYMQYVPGGTLADVIKSLRLISPRKRCGRDVIDSIDSNLIEAGQFVPDDSRQRHWFAELDWSRVVCQMGIQLADALDHAHRQGVLHRDIKPANILLTAMANPKIADFNVSHYQPDVATGDSASLDQTFGGTLAYMPPEQLRAADRMDPTRPDALDARSDTYSLAIVLWELWTGTRPWSGEPTTKSFQEAVGQILKLRGEPIPARPEEQTSTAAMLDETLRACLEPDPAARPASALAMAGQLRIALDPEAAALFRPASGSWFSRVKRLPFWWAYLLVVILPNVVAACFNWYYNDRQIITPLEEQGHDDVVYIFKVLVVLVNAVCFSVGIAVIVYFGRQATAVLNRFGNQHAPDDLAPQNVTAEEIDSVMRMGGVTAIVAIGCWVLAAIIYPTVLWNLAPGFSSEHAVEFFLSLMICGFIASAYPFMLLTWFANCVFYPRLVEAHMRDDDAESRFAHLRRRGEIYLRVAAGVPLLAMMLLILDPELPRYAMFAAVIAGVAGVFWVFGIHRDSTSAGQTLTSLMTRRSVAES